MRLMDLLCEELIEPTLAAAGRDAVIAELVDLLVDRSAIPPAAREDVLRAVLAREESMTTGLGGGVAVPHALCEHVEEVVGALGIHAEGVAWEALDDQPVRLVLLLLVPPGRFQAHIRTLAGVARVMNDPALRRLLFEASDARTVMDILEEREEAAAGF